MDLDQLVTEKTDILNLWTREDAVLIFRSGSFRRGSILFLRKDFDRYTGLDPLSPNEDHYGDLNYYFIYQDDKGHTRSYLIVPGAIHKIDENGVDVSIKTGKVISKVNITHWNPKYLGKA
jgi:hypothetical protein